MSSLLRSLTDLPLSRTGINRNYTARTPENALNVLAGNKATRVIVVRGRQALATGGGLRLLHPSEVRPEHLLGYLGHTLHDEPDAPAGTTVLLAVEPEPEPAPEPKPEPESELEPVAQTSVADVAPAAEVASPTTQAASAPAPLTVDRTGAEWLDLRSTGDALSARDADLLTEAMALVNWHASYLFCPRCGSPTVNDQAGWARRCQKNGHELFPRTDPAVIVLVLDENDRLLLGSNALWEHNRYSLLAGFVEAGESFEQAVIREVEEESGVTVSDPRYLGSQPWPFPRSLMVGFEAHVAGGTDASALRPDGQEILDLRWFTRADLRDENSGLLLPGRTSIARALIDAWLAADGGSTLERRPDDPFPVAR